MGERNHGLPKLGRGVDKIPPSDHPSGADHDLRWCRLVDRPPEGNDSGVAVTASLRLRRIPFLNGALAQAVGSIGDAAVAGKPSPRMANIRWPANSIFPCLGC